MVNIRMHEDGDSLIPLVYESYEGALTTQTNWSLKTNGSKFVVAPRFHYAYIRTDSSITLKINSASNNSITLTSTVSPFEIEGMTITDLLISNVGTANVKIFLK